METKKRILVVSSANMDFVMNVAAVPPAGATVIEGGGYRYVPGGKGANSAVAFGRLGGDTAFCTCLGRDANGDALDALYRAEGIDVSFIARDEVRPTGLAAILVEENGANRIIVYPGANAAIPDAVIRSAVGSMPEALFLQLEIAHESVILASNEAFRRGIPVFLDAGPADRAFPLDRLSGVEVFSPNETETEVFTGIAPTDDASCHLAAEALSHRVKAKHYVLKLGGRGAYVYTPGDGRSVRIPAYSLLPVVDTTAAGDAFTAALTLEYLRTGDIERAVRYGNAVGAITVSRSGASTSIPTVAQIDSFIKKHAIVL